MKTNEENEQESEVLDFTTPTYTFKPNEVHDWRQQGIYLVCKSCELQHATFIGKGKMLVGLTDDGRPLLVDENIYKQKGYVKAYEEAKEHLQKNK